MNIYLCLIGIASSIEGVILDPALYLSPSPPLTTTVNNDAEKLWSQMPQDRKMDSTLKDDTEKTSTESPEIMEDAETFWPIYSPTSLRGIHIPLTFHLSGTYGGKSGTGVLTSGYMGGVDTSGDSGLAGSGYKSYANRPGIRVYGSDAKPAWGGWGNGRWGHYGKG